MAPLAPLLLFVYVSVMVSPNADTLFPHRNHTSLEYGLEAYSFGLSSMQLLQLVLPDFPETVETVLDWIQKYCDL